MVVPWAARTVILLLGYRFHPRRNWRLRGAEIAHHPAPFGRISPHVSISQWHQACSDFFLHPRSDTNEPADRNGGAENGSLNRTALQFPTCSGEHRLGDTASCLYHPGHGESSIRSSATNSISVNPRVPPVRREKFGR